MAKRIVYITRDIERALGIEPSSSFHIITFRDKYAEKLEAIYPDFIHLIEPHSDSASTDEIIKDPSIKSIINESKDSAILVFKNTSIIEETCKANGWQLLNPPSVLSEKIENKISQIEILGDLADKYLPKHTIDTVGNIKWQDKPFIIQWAHGHTGEGTILINSEDDLNSVKEKFPKRPARISDFVDGYPFTLNAIVTKDKILTGNISYQITGLSPFTDNRFSTVGNDWALVNKLLNDNDRDQIQTIAEEVGQKLKTLGWLGLFGIDVIKDISGKIYLIEINARQPASTTFESYLQSKNKMDQSGVSVFEAHLLALQKESVNKPIIQIHDGAQIIQRITKEILANGLDNARREQAVLWQAKGYNTIVYNNKDWNADLIRIQSGNGLMQ